MPASGRRRILILGGTFEGRELAAQLLATGEFEVLSSLAGVTLSPALPPGKVRSGGFGGATGLAQFLIDQTIEVVVDATHPFAVRITDQAIAAARVAGRPMLRLERPAWTSESGDQWHEVADLAAALRLVPLLGRRVFATIGQRLAAELPDGPDLAWVVRSIERPVRLPVDAIWISERGPFMPEGELALLRAQRIDVLLARASGGEGARAKLTAARQLSLPVVLLSRPPSPEGVSLVETPEAALIWLRHAIGGAGGNS